MRNKTYHAYTTDGRYLYSTYTLKQCRAKAWVFGDCEIYHNDEYVFTVKVNKRAD